MNSLLIYIGGATSLIWGISHLLPTKNVVKDFGPITKDNQRILMMDWINEGATLIFMGVLTIAITFTNPYSSISVLVYWFVVGMLLIWL